VWRTLIIALAVAAAVWLVIVALLVVFGKRSQAREFAAFLPNLVLLFKGLARDPRVTRGSKVLLLIGVVWFISPIDLIPEFIPVAGPLDDAVVAVLILRHILKKAGREVVAEHWRGDPAVLQRLLRLTGTGRQRQSGTSGS
jgi:uncharacterized membrane protein YkvA (DUF1232 family)